MALDTHYVEQLTPQTGNSTLPNFVTGTALDMSASKCGAHFGVLGGTSSGTVSFGVSGNEKIAQSFQVTGGTQYITGILLLFGRVGNPTDDVKMSIQTDSTGEPSGTEVWTETFTGSEMNTTISYPKFVPLFLKDTADIFQLTGSTTYWLVLERTGSLDGSNYWQCNYDSTGYTGGTAASYASGSWTNEAYDLRFKILGPPYMIVASGMCKTSDNKESVLLQLGRYDGSTATAFYAPGGLRVFDVVGTVLDHHQVELNTTTTLTTNLWVGLYWPEPDYDPAFFCEISNSGDTWTFERGSIFCVELDPASFEWGVDYRGLNADRTAVDLNDYFLYGVDSGWHDDEMPSLMLDAPAGSDWLVYMGAVAGVQSTAISYEGRLCHASIEEAYWPRGCQSPAEWGGDFLQHADTGSNYTGSDFLSRAGPGDNTNERIAQRFRVSSAAEIDHVVIYGLYRSISRDANNITLRIETDSSGEPSGTLVTNGAFKGSALAGTNADFEINVFKSDTPASTASLSADTDYWLVLAYEGTLTAGPYYHAYAPTGFYDTYTYGYKREDGGVWTTLSGYIPFMVGKLEDQVPYQSREGEQAGDTYRFSQFRVYKNLTGKQHWYGQVRSDDNSGGMDDVYYQTLFAINLDKFESAIGNTQIDPSPSGWANYHGTWGAVRQTTASRDVIFLGMGIIEPNAAGNYINVVQFRYSEASDGDEICEFYVPDDWDVKTVPFNNGTVDRIAQSFQLDGSCTAKGLELLLVGDVRVGSPAGTVLRAEIWDDNSGEPGSIVGTWNRATTYDHWDQCGGLTWRAGTGSGTVTLSADTTYWIVVFSETETGDASNYNQIVVDNDLGGYGVCKLSGDAGATWGSAQAYSLLFCIQTADYVLQTFAGDDFEDSWDATDRLPVVISGRGASFSAEPHSAHLVMSSETTSAAWAYFCALGIVCEPAAVPAVGVYPPWPRRQLTTIRM